MPPHADSTRVQTGRLRLVAIHLGVGNSRDHEGAKRLAKQICEDVMLPNGEETKSKKTRKTCCHQLEQNEESPAELAVVKLIEKMENHHSLNCGFGSNLNMNGQVECDASLMCDKTQAWTGVGAIMGCKNPILLAKSLYDHRTVDRPLGLIQPNFLAGSGAKTFMREHCPQLITRDSHMISSEALTNYQKFKSRYDTAKKIDQTVHTIGDITTKETANQIDDNLPIHLDHGSYCMTSKISEDSSEGPTESGQNLAHDHSYSKTSLEESIVTKNTRKKMNERVKNALVIEELEADISVRLDTVGAVVVDENNNFASAISSGGLLLKYKGRVGQAAVPGAGCWAEDCVAATTTGVGEYLTVSLFAKRFYDKISTLRLLYDLGHVETEQGNDLSNFINSVIGDCFEDLLRSPALAHVAPHERSAGLLSVSSLNSHNSPKRVGGDDLYLSFAHNTKSMCIGYMTCNDTSGHSLVSHDPNNCNGSVLIKTMRVSY